MKKRLLVFVAACSMMISMTGCGGSDKKETTAEVEINEPTKTVAEDDTTEGNTAEPDVIVSEEMTTVDDATEDTEAAGNTEASSEDVSGMECLNGVYYDVQGMTLYQDNGNTRVYMSADKTETLAIAVTNQGTVSESDMYTAYENQIKKVYGDNYTEDKYNNGKLDFVMKNYLNGNVMNNSIDVKTYVNTNGTLTIYLEHCVKHGEAFPATAERILDSIVIK